MFAIKEKTNNMMGEEKMSKKKLSFSQAVSPSKDWYVTYSKPDKNGRKKVDGIFCHNTDDISKICAIAYDMCGAGTPVFRISEGDRYQFAGLLGDIVEKKKGKLEACSDISDKVLEDGFELIDDEDLLPEFHSDHSDNRILESIDCSEYSDVSDACDNVVLLKKKKEVSAVNRMPTNRSSAIEAYNSLLKQNDLDSLRKATYIAQRYFDYDTRLVASEDITRRLYEVLVYKGDWQSLKKAKGIAGKYFNREEQAKSDAVVSMLMEKKAADLADDAICGLLDKTTATEVYKHLVASKNTTNLAKAVNIARLYLSNDMAEKTNRLRINVIKWKRATGEFEKEQLMLDPDQTNNLRYLPSRNAQQYERVA